ncbi:unnamed protein product, partial [Ixodes pacificus]
MRSLFAHGGSFAIHNHLLRFEWLSEAWQEAHDKLRQRPSSIAQMKSVTGVASPSRTTKATRKQKSRRQSSTARSSRPPNPTMPARVELIWEQVVQPRRLAPCPCTRGCRDCLATPPP